VKVGCLEEGTVVAFLGGALDADARIAVEEHIAACGACAEVVTWAAADQASSTMRLPGHEGRPFVGQLQPGSRVGRYQILGAVGRGGMGEVYAAYHPDLDRRIALKVVGGLGADASERRARLLREARAIARLSHPNVVGVHDAGSFGDRVFIAMEFVDGLTVDQWLRAERRTWQQILDVFIAAGRGLAAAHAADIVHRDVKPQNMMIARDGTARVMDFGLARLSADDGSTSAPQTDDLATMSLGPLTRTGALVGTPAYMSPEQYRREATDVRSDQFSFCVALHEALYGTRPATALGDHSHGSRAAVTTTMSVPGWLHSILLRGSSERREQRYRSMDDLIVALERGRTRLRRRVSASAIGFSVLVLGLGGWRLADGNRFACAVPDDRIATPWSPHTGDARRQSIHGAFAATGRSTAETSWQRLSKVLDAYVAAWTAMYMQTCEATHVRREQSADVLDLRMSCLSDNLDQVRALTETLLTDGGMLSRAVAAAHDLAPVSRCGDVALLRSAAPLPRDERTLRAVRRLRRELATIEAYREAGQLPRALRDATALKQAIETANYPPLRGEYLAVLGAIETQLHSEGAAKTLEEALFTAESARDDATAARATAMLVYVVGLNGGTLAESERWFRLSNSILDRLPSATARIRAWALQNLASVYTVNGKLVEAKSHVERAVALKLESLGPDHPDLAISVAGAGWILNQLGRPAEALPLLDRAIAILTKSSDPNAPILAGTFTDRGEALLALGRYEEAQESSERGLAILEEDPGLPPFGAADALAGLGRVRLAQGEPLAALPLLERARVAYERFAGTGTAAADNQFALARALWNAGADRRRASDLGRAARAPSTSVPIEVTGQRSSRSGSCLARSNRRGHALRDRAAADR
jgi:serine/threonine protein kinase/tetratricopeptide (TPR) repeat protein